MSKNFVVFKAVVWVLCLTGVMANAQSVAISEGGTPAYSVPIAVPPGIAGMAPNIGLLYSGGGLNGPLGAGWSVQGISMITRCPNTKAIDGSAHGVDYAATDKLCLDGQRLIQTDANGSTTTSPFPQSNDSLGDATLGNATMVHEYRTEKDSFARIRSYGAANSVAANGPAYFKVWTKSGQIYEYGDHSNGTAKSAITITGKTVNSVTITAISAWAVSRISDTLGNYIDFQYTQSDVAWGSGTVAGSPTLGHEWNLQEIRYTGTPTQLPTNKVLFSYALRTSIANTVTTGARQDRSEAYGWGRVGCILFRLGRLNIRCCSSIDRCGNDRRRWC